MAGKGKAILDVADVALDAGGIIAALASILRARAEKYSEHTAERHQAAEMMRGRLECVLQSIPPSDRAALDRRYDQSKKGWPIGHWRMHHESDFAMLILKMLREDKTDDEWREVLHGLNNRTDEDFWRAMERLDHAPNVESFQRILEVLVTSAHATAALIAKKSEGVAATVGDRIEKKLGRLAQKLKDRTEKIKGGKK